MRGFRGVLCCALASAGLATASGASVIFDLSIEFSGATSPTGPGPWLRATFNDVPGGVTLTLQSLLNGASEFVNMWDFNFDPALNPTQLSFAVQSGGPAAQTISTGVNAFQADGDGRYDIEFDFPNSGPNRFNGADMVTYMITHPSPISVSSFDFLSAPGGGAGGPLPTAAHVQGINDAFSGWISTPEPASLVMWSIAGLLAIRRR